MRTTFRLLPALLLALAGCVRDFPLPPPPDAGVKVGSGSACAQDGECLSGHCIDGYCCTSACQSFEVCNAPGSVGRCTPRLQGAGCDAGAMCPSGACVSGLCCDRECQSSEACDLPGTEGQCTPRTVGLPCDGGEQCASGACADGVCCDRACTGTCESCVLDGGVGTCQAAPDNTDPRARCGTCLACFGGLCAPALPGTDPNGACGVGKTCTAAQVCAAAGGSSCSSDGDCAAGVCINGQCQSIQAETLFASGMATNATLRTPEGLVADATSRATALFTETTLSGPFDPFSDQTESVLEVALRVATRNAQGHWTVATVQRDTCSSFYTYTPSALLRLGAYAYVVAYSDAVTNGYTCGQNSGPKPGLYGALVSPSGTVVGYEPINTQVMHPIDPALGARDDGTLVTAFRNRDPSLEDGGTPLEVWERLQQADAGHAWSRLGIWSNDADSVAMAQLLGQPVVIWADRDGGAYGDPVYLQARRPDDPVATPARFVTDEGQAVCCDNVTVAPSSSQPTIAESALFTLYCKCHTGDEGFVLGQVTEADGGLAFHFQPLSFSGSLSFVTALPGPLLGGVNDQESESTISWLSNNRLSTRTLTTAGAGQSLRPVLYGATPSTTEALFLVGSAATAAGASPDLQLVRLAP